MAKYQRQTREQKIEKTKRSIRSHIYGGKTFSSRRGRELLYRLHLLTGEPDIDATPPVV